jgi:MFS family permease
MLTCPRIGPRHVSGASLARSPFWLSPCKSCPPRLLRRQVARETQQLNSLVLSSNFTCISIVPIAGTIVGDLSGGHADKSASVLLVTIWELGEAAGPLILAPLSEMYGRRPVLNVANVLLVAAVGLAAVSPSTTVFIATRALCGLVVTCNVLNPAIMGDMWDPVSRGSPMSLIALCQFAGGSAGPLLGSFITDNFHWRWVMGMNVGLAVVCTVLLYACYQETYLPVIHHRQLQKLHKSAENGMASTLDGKKRGFTELVESVTRPIIVFASSGVLASMSFFGGISFSHYYNMATTLPGILQDQYGLSSSLTGLAFIFFSKPHP